MDKAEAAKVRKDFREAVNMPPSALEKWLKTEESRKVGWVDGAPKRSTAGGESVGHKSGRRIIAIKKKRAGELTDADLAHMKKVVGYVNRHMAQRPGGDVSESRWRYSLMNWGCDPMKAR